jgi:hypothetical protein
MVMAVPTASWFDPETEQCMRRIVRAPDSVTDVVEDVLGLRSSRVIRRWNSLAMKARRCQSQLTGVARS